MNNQNKDYQEFLKSKVKSVKLSGFTVDPNDLNPKMYPFQRDIVLWALELGKAAIWAEVGLGKTIMQLEWAQQVAKHTGKPVLILAPLAVADQTIREGEKFGYTVEYVLNGQVKTDCDIIITNYDRVEKFEGHLYGGVVLDESSILKNSSGATNQKLNDIFTHTPYKLACSATPSPNDHTEIGQHSEFLDIMPSVQMLATWFKHDSSRTQNWRLKHNAKDAFWYWVSTWAICITTPADLGEEYHIEGYNLPPLNILDYRVDASDEAIEEAHANGRLIPDTAVSSTQLGAKKRQSLDDRLAVCQSIVDDIPNDDAIIIWCHLNDEQDALEKMFPDALSVRGGSKNRDSNRDKLLKFSNNENRMIITKPKIAGFGMNWQHCHDMIFVGLDFSFESFFQTTGRCHRYGQTEEVNVHLIYAETEGNLITTLERKRELFNDMRRDMIAIMQEYGLAKKHKEIVKMEHGIKRQGENWTMYRGDCVEQLANIEDESIDFSVFSPPFSDLYTYSRETADFGNSATDEEFFEQFNFLIDELMRVMVAGRLVAIHCADLPYFKWKDGFIGRKDFPGMIIDAFTKRGWVYHSRITIDKNPVVEMQRTKAKGLLHKQFKKDASHVRQGGADYIVVLRKPGEDKPVIQERVEGDYIGTDIPTGNGGKDSYSIEVWQRYANPVWYDIEQGDVLNNFRKGRDVNDEKHICPLQLGVIARLVDLWTMKGDTVLSPFAGIGSEGYESLRLGRKFVGIELKESYFEIACENLESAEILANSPTLFDLSEYEVAAD